MKIQNKILITFILFLGIIIFSNNKTFASFDFCYNGTNYSLPDIPSAIASKKYIFMCAKDTDTGIMFHLAGTDESTFYSVSFGGYNAWIEPPDYSSWTVSKATNGSSLSSRLNYSGMSLIYTKTDVLDKTTGTIVFKAGFQESQADKINLFELNLTDLDYDNQVHKFNTATYTNSSCYDEIMNYYINNYQYSIFVTDYQRILSYENYDDDDSFLYGSYILSGYIDFLITDKSFFYYSKYYNNVMSNSGTKIFGKDVEDYTKRFYFKLTYSEDSNDPYATIWEDNGNLFSIDYLETFEHTYFVGSSQTIYYAEENGNKFSDITSNVFYLGYLNSMDGLTRDISETPFYVYNFDYAGGYTELYVVNQNDYNYEEMIKNRYDNYNEYYDKWTIIPDSTEGGSYLQGNDLTSSTFQEGQVTNNSSLEDAEKYIGQIRTAQDSTDNIDYKKNTESKVNDGTIISYIFNNIKNKFGFSDNLINNANEIKDYIVNTQETHKYYLTINSKYLSGDICIIDLSWYAPYKSTADAFICAFAYLSFIWHMFCALPNLIRGSSVSSYVSEISTYTHNGVGRSSNIHKGGF